jgi:hypothetical protein
MLVGEWVSSVNKNVPVTNCGQMEQKIVNHFAVRWFEFPLAHCLEGYLRHVSVLR